LSRATLRGYVSVLVLGLVLVAGAVGVSSCSITSDHFSCGIKTGNTLVRCVDYEDVDVQFRATVETLCHALGGDFSVDKTCTNDGKVGGCKQIASGYTQTAWYYTGSIAPTVPEIMGRCSGPEFYVDPDGTKPTDLGTDVPDQSAVADLSLPSDLTSHD